VTIFSYSSFLQFGLSGGLESMKASCFSVSFKQNLHNKFGKDLDAKVFSFSCCYYVPDDSFHLVCSSYQSM
jgi:hypothetical protein